MGFRFRKSINLGCGFRVNLSKSGIGYSWGVKGYRVTRTAKGGTRTTASLPGTGISFVSESSGARNKNKCLPPTPSPKDLDSNYYDTKDIQNGIATNMVSDGLNELLEAASSSLKIKRRVDIAFWIALVCGILFPPLLLIAAVLFALKFVVKSKLSINIDYDIDSDYTLDDRIKFMRKVARSDKVWRITQTSKVIDKKYSAGASQSVNRVVCATNMEAPFPFKTNAKVASFKSGKETLVFMPDKLFIIQGNKIGALSYSDIESSTSTTRFIEKGALPRDAEVVDKTWQKVNKSGGPDRRFKNNRELPICHYGEIYLSSNNGLNTIIMYSNAKIQ